ncbi:Sin3 associated polypeptide p18-domain-containing protein, partial [Cunninghamella echinulata]
DCPFLLKVYNQVGRHHNILDFQIDSVPIEDELQLYTWKDATLGELALLIQEVIPEARHIDARISFRLVFLDTGNAKYIFKQLGKVINSEETPDQNKTLEECKFYIGDYLDVAIYDGPPPSSTTGIVGAGAAASSSLSSNTSFKSSGNRYYSSSRRGGGFGRYSNNDRGRPFGRQKY